MDTTPLPGESAPAVRESAEAEKRRLAWEAARIAEADATAALQPLTGRRRAARAALHRRSPQ
jgi:hypothetical protein